VIRQNAANQKISKRRTAMADENRNPEATPEIEPLSDESLEDVAGGLCSILLCSTPAPKSTTP
jgi:hypothetical protein